MTLIVGVTDGAHVWMGGDAGAFTVDTGSATSRVETKVFALGELLLGFAGSFRFGQLVRHAFTPPARPRTETVDHYLVTSFAASLRTTLKTHGCGFMEHEVETTGSDNSPLLIGVGGRLFEMYGDYSVGETVDHYTALGIASDIALGALAVTPQLPPERRLRRALEAGMRHNAFVRGPFTVLSNVTRKPPRKR